ncbi:substrate-binding periplasmic protein [Methanocorpusculum vombati]|nr:transporter substrate-binding domain-containing protein [Methanocorpusculum vombati]MCZ9318764.1 transporter substrate-binding domain-containing protein [Methanocorpusculum sp.]MDE2533892.1 transporter substrate-binding domain-containing protein [Methanocorpusculum sp.]MDE2546773.1 transporter substrate-binding domain-containing protein [Methanocorpusculum sp.]MDE2548037.1 transporter substrate-binding domain-containing protein [Methanocorpusculum sp.]
MKKKIIIGILLLAVLMIMFTAGCVDSTSKQAYVIGVDTAMSPWEYIDKDGNPQGINMDLIEMIAADQGFSYTYYVPENAGWEMALVNGKIDTIGAVVITPEREDKYVFVEMPFEPTSYLVIARADSGLTLDDVLAGNASIAVFDNSVYVEWLKTHFGDAYNTMVADGKIIIKVTADELAFSVLSREADAAIAGTMTLGSQLNTYQPLKFLGFVGEPKSIGFIMRKNETDLYQKLTAGFENIQQTPEFADLVKKYNLQYRKDIYTVGIDESNEPWTYVGADGNYTGFDIEMVTWIAEQEGLDITFKPTSWKRNLNEIVTGNLDMWASSMGITDDRLRYVAFSNPYYISGIGVAVRPDSPLTKDDFEKADAKISVVYESTYSSWLEKHLGTDVYNRKIKDGSIALVADHSGMVAKLTSGEVDFIVVGDAQMKAAASKAIMKPVFIDEGVEEFGIAMSNGNFVLQSLINDGISKFISSGKSAELQKKYGV